MLMHPEAIVERVVDEEEHAEVEAVVVEVSPTRLDSCVSSMELTEQNHSAEDYVVDVEGSEVAEVDTPTLTAHHKLPTAKPPRQIRPPTDGPPKSRLQLLHKRLKAQKTPRTKTLPNHRLRQSLLARETISLLPEDGEMHHRQRN